MSKFLNNKKLGLLLPYFLLALAIIVAWKIISELGFFLGAVHRLWSIVTPFFYGFLLAYIINIPCGGIQRLLGRVNSGFVRRRKNGLSILLVFIIFALIVSLSLNFIIPAIASSIALFIANFESHHENALRLVANISSFDLFGFRINGDWILGILGDIFAGFHWQDMLANFQWEDLFAPLRALMGVGTALFSAFLAFISSIYILFEKDKFKTFLRRLLKALVHPWVFEVTMEYADKLNVNFKRYIFTQTIDGLIVGTIVTIQLYFMGSPYFLLLGVILGILNYIPYFGSMIGSAIAIVVVMFTQGLTMGMIAAVILLITQQIDGNIIQPKLMGGSFAISPLLIIISITIGGALAGILGMIAAIPIVAVLRDMLESIVAHYEKKREDKQICCAQQPSDDSPE